MSRVGQAGLAGSSTPPAAQRLARTASVSPVAATAPGESYNGHWAGGRGPGGRPGGRGAAGSPEASLFARFPSTMAAPLFPLSSSSSSALPAAASRCLCLQAARPPSPGHPTPLLGEAGEAEHGTHTHSHSHTQTHAAPAGSFLSPFLSLLLPLLPARSPSLSPNEAPGRAEGGAAPPAPPPPCEQEEERGGREEGLLRKTKERRRSGDRGPNQPARERPGWRGDLRGEQQNTPH